MNFGQLSQLTANEWQRAVEKSLIKQTVNSGVFKLHKWMHGGDNSALFNSSPSETVSRVPHKSVMSKVNICVPEQLI